MNIDITVPELQERLLRDSKTIAVVGLSPKEHRDSYQVASYLQAQGYRIIPVNPAAREILGETSYPDLASVPGPVDLVDVFRRSELVPPVVEQAVHTDAAFVGMIGSRRKIALMWKELEAEGIPRERLEAVHAPLGLDIGADNPEEIAVSVVAELISTRRSGGKPAHEVRSLSAIAK